MKNYFLKLITVISAVLWLLSACCLDADSWTPVIVWMITSVWLSLFIVANCREVSHG